jgi:predicted enzyme related to lactoylglutathione lyase
MAPHDERAWASPTRILMKVTVSIDVPTLDEGLAFFGGVFGFVETARPHPGYAILSLGEATIGLLAKEAGSSPAAGSSDIRSYKRHWTPVHVDFRVEDFDATLERALEEGAKLEQVHRLTGFPPVAFCSDPFGHGFCLIGLNPL